MFPAIAAIEVAQIRSLRHPHSAARNIRPPSRGKAGTRLKTKDSECPIEVSQIPQNAGDGSRTLRIGDEAEQEEEQEAEDSARDRSGQCHEEFVERARRLAMHLGDT